MEKMTKEEFMRAAAAAKERKRRERFQRNSDLYNIQRDRKRRVQAWEHSKKS